MSEEEKFTEAEFKTKFNEGGWVEALPEELLSEPTLSKFSKGGFDQLAKSYVELQKGYGDRVPKPKQTFKPSEWADWNREYNEGFPESAEGYNLELENVPDSVPFDIEEDAKLYRELVHKYGLTASQAQGMWQEVKKKQIDVYQGQMDSIESMKKTDRESLNKEWGSAYEEKMKLARGVLQKFAPQSIIDDLGKTHVNADIWMMLAAIGDNFREGTIETTSTPVSTRTPSETKLKIAELTAKPEYLNSDMSGHRDLVLQVSQLHQDIIDARDAG